jgi:hypothetical protein
VDCFCTVSEVHQGADDARYGAAWNRDRDHREFGQSRPFQQGKKSSDAYNTGAGLSQRCHQEHSHGGYPCRLPKGWNNAGSCRRGFRTLP